MRRLLSLLCLIACTAPLGAETRFEWPGGARAAVSLAYDDALASQLDTAIPALNRHGLRGSFYLTLSSRVVESRLDEWKAAAALGHELGNHSLFHQCSRRAPGREWVTANNDLDQVPVDRMLAEVRLGNAMLHAIDGRRKRTFTVPCGDTHASGGDYVSKLRGEFVAIKSGAGDVVPSISLLNPYAVPVSAPSGATGEQLITLVTAAAARGTMVNITFHGIGGDHLAVSAEAHDTLLAHLASHRDVYWTETFIEVMTYVESARRSGPQFPSETVEFSP